MRILTLAFLGLFAAAMLLEPAPAAAGGKGITKSADHQSTVVDRRKPRVPGGSGCDDPDDILEHPECR